MLQRSVAWCLKLRRHVRYIHVGVGLMNWFVRDKAIPKVMQICNPIIVISVVEAEIRDRKNMATVNAANPDITNNRAPVLS